MRLYEFADAEAQLALLRTIIDNTWTAISQQAEQEKRAKAERKAKAQLKPRARKSSKGTSIRMPAPPPLQPNKPQAALAKQPPSPLDKSKPNAVNAVKPLPTTYPPLKQPPASTTIDPKLASTPSPQPLATTTIKPNTGAKPGNFGKDIDTTEKEEGGDDRHSKNGIATHKKPATTF